jgi:hypothetical protein
MAKGFDRVEQATQAAQEQRERVAQNSKPQLFTSTVKPSKGGGPVNVRFLEQGQDVNNFNRHAYQVPGPNGAFFHKQFTCLREAGQECPGCKAGLKLKLRGVFNIIQRNRPQLRKDKDGKAIKINDQYVVDGYQDEVVILDVPSTTAEAFRKIDNDYRGLMSRDFTLGESGSTFQPWDIRPADVDGGPQPMSEADVALMQTKRHNLDEFMKPPSAAEAQQIVNQYGGNSGQGGGGGYAGNGAQGNAAQAPQANGFLQGADPAAVAAATGGAFGAAQQG